jgi:type VI protein secretion system component Hcp
MERQYHFHQNGKLLVAAILASIASVKGALVAYIKYTIANCHIINFYKHNNYSSNVLAY